MRSPKSIRLNEALVVFALLFSLINASPAFAESNHTYNEDLSKLQGFDREIDDLQKGIHHMVAEKKHTDEKTAVKQLVDQIAESYKRLQKVSNDRERLWLHIRFKHPEQATALEKRYTRFKLKTLEDMEAEVGIDGRLDRIKARVMATFPAPEAVEEKKDDTKVHPFYRKPASVDDDAPEEIKLVK
ncbi:MAG: hypothetical protein V4760_11885 [Bdellovibrionota bacterium]